MVRCSFNHWLGWMSSATKWPPWRRRELLALIATVWPLHLLCAQSPTFFFFLQTNSYIGVCWASIQVDFDLSPFAWREKMLSRNLPSMNTGPLFSNYDAFRSSSRHTRLYTMPFGCVHSGGVPSRSYLKIGQFWELCMWKSKGVLIAGRCYYTKAWCLK